LKKICNFAVSNGEPKSGITICNPNYTRVYENGQITYVGPSRSKPKLKPKEKGK
jgi:hypothetical protein